MVAACKDGGLTWAGSGQIPANTEVTGNEEYAALPYRSNYQDEVEKAVLPTKNPTLLCYEGWHDPEPGYHLEPVPMMQQPVLMHLLTSCLLTWNKAQSRKGELFKASLSFLKKLIENCLVSGRKRR